ncbi:hypothetical protein EVAR_89766_1 [Eumeta japonica]|uniref:Uncharacterized protein n=1 Tax=Eumeta variegata TaxID=151549 RepID=A0A4C1XDD1_EUMVA|nr:hypothetical protein EVAR_89766_1 [Eumeta japonica]
MKTKTSGRNEGRRRFETLFIACHLEAEVDKGTPQSRGNNSTPDKGGPESYKSDLEMIANDPDELYAEREQLESQYYNVTAAAQLLVEKHRAPKRTQPEASSLDARTSTTNAQNYMNDEVMKKTIKKPLIPKIRRAADYERFAYPKKNNHCFCEVVNSEILDIRDHRDARSHRTNKHSARKMERIYPRALRLSKQRHEFDFVALRLGVTYEKVTLGNVTMSHRTREVAECLASLHSTMIGLPRAQH